MEVIASRAMSRIIIILATFFSFCLPAPAEAFWGDYGPEPPPEMFGVRLGDDIRNYKGMAMYPGPYTLLPFRKLYQRQDENGLTFEGVPLRKDDPKFRPYYCTYKNKIFDISFYVRPEDYEKAAQKLNAMFGPPQEQPESAFDKDIKYIWRNSEVLVESSREGKFHVQWLPIEKNIYEYFAEKWDKPITFCGVAMGGKVEDYPFLEEISREGPEIVHYSSKSALPYGMVSCVFSAYRGVMYEFTFIFGDNMPGRRGEKYYSLVSLGFPDYDDKDILFWGDVQVTWLWSNTVYVWLVPAYWDANRARLAYYRNLKPD